MRLLILFRSRSSKFQPRSSASHGKWAWALLALILLSLMIAACSARTLSMDELAAIFVEGDWLDSMQAGAGAQPNANSPSICLDSSIGCDDAGEGNLSEPTPTPSPGSNPEKITATPDPNSAEHTATPTPGVENTATPTQTGMLATSTATPTVKPPTATQTSQAPTATSTSAVPTATPAACSYSSNASYEITLVALINQERANQGIAAMTTSSQLTAAARQHSRDMACNDFFSHTGSDGSSPFSRMISAGFSYTAAAENIYAGGGTPQMAFNAWMNSTGHRVNMLNPAYTHIGVGYIYSAGSTYGSYFTADFARP